MSNSGQFINVAVVHDTVEVLRATLLFHITPAEETLKLTYANKS